MRRAGAALCLCLWCLASVSASDLDKDSPGAKDLADIPRFEGAVLIGSRSSGPEETLIPTGPWNAKARGGGAWEDSVSVQGSRIRVLYLAPREVEARAVTQSYQRVLAAQGYEALFQCSGHAECGEEVEQLYIDGAQGKQLTDSYLLESAFSETTVRDPQLFVARRKDADGESYVLLFAAYQDNFADSAAGDRVAIFVEQARATSQGALQRSPVRRELLDAASIARGLEESGSVALYGIEPADDGSEPPPSARPQLDALAQMLSAQPELEVFLVGHTDNSRPLEEGMRLSRQHAQAVVDALIRSYGILGARLTPEGVANLAPVASNATEEGRAMNRRIELVAR